MINQIHQFQLVGRVEISDPIDPDTEYALYLERVQNDQGKQSKYLKDDTEVITYKLVNLGTAMLSAGGKNIMGKPKKGSKSQALRLRIRELWETAHAGRMDEEAFYNECLDKYLAEVQEQIDYYKN
jgi:hypothetical protein